jgi:hypothetical protein
MCCKIPWSHAIKAFFIDISYITFSTIFGVETAGQFCDEKNASSFNQIIQYMCYLFKLTTYKDFPSEV